MCTAHLFIKCKKKENFFANLLLIFKGILETVVIFRSKSFFPKKTEFKNSLLFVVTFLVTKFFASCSLIYCLTYNLYLFYLTCGFSVKNPYSFAFFLFHCTSISDTFVGWYPLNGVAAVVLYRFPD